MPLFTTGSDNALREREKAVSESAGRAMRRHASHRTVGIAAAADSLQLVLETSSWIAAWLILPAWLAFHGAGLTDFLLYAAGAGLLLSLGVAADRPDAFRNAAELAWFGTISFGAVLLVGGACFGIAVALQ